MGLARPEQISQPETRPSAGLFGSGCLPVALEAAAESLEEVEKLPEEWEAEGWLQEEAGGGFQQEAVGVAPVAVITPVKKPAPDTMLL